MLCWANHLGFSRLFDQPRRWPRAPLPCGRQLVQMRQIVEPIRGLVQLPLPIVLHQRDVVCGFEAVDQQLRDAGNQALVALDNDVHALEGRSKFRIKQLTFSALDVAHQKHL